MKVNFKCPKCKKGIKVGKKLHASYTCPNCKYTMVLSREDVAKGTVPYRSRFRDEDQTFNKKSFKKPFKRYNESKVVTK